ncbi:MAG: hypothetical protein RRB13_03770 [bacterium]|nr:hypothetical protein [bacterium]
MARKGVKGVLFNLVAEEGRFNCQVGIPLDQRLHLRRLCLGCKHQFGLSPQSAEEPQLLCPNCEARGGFGDFHLPEQQCLIQHTLRSEALERYAYRQSSNPVKRWFLKEQTKSYDYLRLLIPQTLAAIPSHPGRKPPIRQLKPLPFLFRCDLCGREFSSEVKSQRCLYCGHAGRLATAGTLGDVVQKTPAAPDSQGLRGNLLVDGTKPAPEVELVNGLQIHEERGYRIHPKKLWGCLAVLFGPWLALYGFGRFITWLGGP